MPYEWTEERMKYWGKTLKLYDLTPTQLSAVRKALLVAQGFTCAICPTRFDNGKVAFLDHDHHSGAIRGMLCYNCNRFRVARNSADTAREVVRYLNSPPAHAQLDAIIARVKARTTEPSTEGGSVS